MRCAIYTRVSTDEQAQPEYNSLQLQAELCQHYIEVQREQGWVVAGVYEDSGFSGKDLKRPALQRLLRDVHRGEIQVVVAYKLDRISRSLRDFYEFWGVLQAVGAIFVSATQSFDTSAPAGNLMLNVLLSFAQFERETTAERTATKMRARAQKGMWNGGYIPYGYEYDPSKQMLLAHEEEARIVRFIFEDFVNLGSVGEICGKLNQEGLRTRSRVIGKESGNPRTVGGGPFRPDTVKSLLQNPIYVGMIRCQGETHQGKHDPLVPVEIFEQAKTLLAERQISPFSTTSSQDAHVHLLKGSIRCADCGSTMTPYPSGKCGKDGERYLYYVCTAVIRNQRGCPCQVRRLPVRRFERAVVQILTSLSDSPEVLRACLRQSSKSDARKLRNHFARRKELLSLNDDLEQQLHRLLSHFGQQDVPVFVGEEIAKLDARREELRKEIADLDVRLEELQGEVVDEGSLRDRLNLLQGVEGQNLEEQKQLVQAIVGRVEVDLWQPPSPSDCPGKPRLRTRRLLVNISLKSVSPSDGRKSRTCAFIPCWGDLDSSRVAAEFVLHHSAPPESIPGVIPQRQAKSQETPADRALRFQKLLQSGEVGSRAALARKLGVGRSWVTEVLKHLPQATPLSEGCPRLDSEFPGTVRNERG
jgi:DNA invertase Pin-like site-specific DNA recombinase